ncbi:saccharopine dehydrogenase C-terminal domain-containing protein [Rapidithrix thailandica]|uniref:Saccharopine dehydrogenase C-terminal domain-containing protein n=1 Tax=Rapidithrix thailandica TaxID=413964 RepID=A0AAW9S628_9BACT
MKKILVIGAGRSSHTLIKYLLEHAQEEDWHVTVGDMDLALAQEKVKGHSRGEAVHFDVTDPKSREREIQKVDLVVSMLPARFHHIPAKTCLQYSIPMVTASYVSPEIKEMDEEAKNKGIILLNEMGLDPGLDHLSAMYMIDRVKNAGGTIKCFESFTGGLLAPVSEKGNPWKYKFTWNPRNVVLAGQGAVKFIQEGRYKYIPYHRLFRRSEVIEVEGYGRFEGYANRDSLKYLDVYGLRGIPTIYRGTLRRPGFSRAWNIFVQLGATDDSYMMEGVEQMTHRQFINSFLSYNPHDSVELKLMHYMHLDQDSDVMEKLEWLGMFEDTPIGLKEGTPAQVLQHILEKKWALTEEDKDMIVMWHKLIYELDGKETFLTSSLVVEGDDHQNTAMAKTVGLPLAIATKLILNGKLKLKGVQYPTSPEIYHPVLEELKKAGINFVEKEQ